MGRGGTMKGTESKQDRRQVRATSRHKTVCRTQRRRRVQTFRSKVAGASGENKEGELECVVPAETAATREQKGEPQQHTTETTQAKPCLGCAALIEKDALGREVAVDDATRVDVAHPAHDAHQHTADLKMVIKCGERSGCKRAGVQE